MANRRAPVTAERWREIKEELVGRVVHQQKVVGVAPNVRAAESWLEPILRQVEVQQEGRRRSDMLRPRKPSQVRERKVERRNTRISVKQASDAELDRIRQKSRASDWKLIRARIRMLLASDEKGPLYPEWRARIYDTIFGPAAPDTSQARRLELWLKIYEDSCKVFGDPLKPHEKKIITLGAQPPAVPPTILLATG
jgi:hypothetical protein